MNLKEFFPKEVMTLEGGLIVMKNHLKLLNSQRILGHARTMINREAPETIKADMKIATTMLTNSEAEHDILNKMHNRDSDEKDQDGSGNSFPLDLLKFFQNASKKIK